MSKGKDSKGGKRFIPAGSCTWCGHPPHDEGCGRKIRTHVRSLDYGQLENVEVACPCGRGWWQKAREQ